MYTHQEPTTWTRIALTCYKISLNQGVIKGAASLTSLRRGEKNQDVVDVLETLNFQRSPPRT